MSIPLRSIKYTVDKSFESCPFGNRELLANTEILKSQMQIDILRDFGEDSLPAGNRTAVNHPEDSIVQLAQEVLVTRTDTGKT